MTARLRTVVAVVLGVVLVVVGPSAAWALWTASGATSSRTTVGTLVAGISGTDAMSVASSGSTPTTRPVTLTNAGTLAGTTATTVSTASGTTAALAAAVDVVAWPVSSAAACTDAAVVGAGSVSGTWAALPSMSSSLGARSSAVWCTRSTPRPDAPASSRADVVLTLTTTTGSWRSAPARGTFTLTTAAAVPAMGCTSDNDNYVTVTWPTADRPMDTWYGAFVQGTMVGAVAQGYSGFTTIAPEQVRPVATSGTQTVVVRVLDSARQPTDTVVASGTVTLFQRDDGPRIRCGS